MSYCSEEEAEEAKTDSSYPATPASQVEPHVTPQEENEYSWASQETVVLDEDNEEAVVCETSILRVVSTSQSFRGSPQDDVQLGE